MPHFFIKSSDISGDICVIRGDDYHHLTRVRRIRAGQKISLVAEDRTRLECRVETIGESEIKARIIDRSVSEGQDRGAPVVDLTVYMSLLKGKKFDFVVQKLTELGVNRIVPVMTERSIPDYDDREKGKLERWKKIALEAAKQSLRDTVPAIDAIVSFMDAVKGDVPGLKIIADPVGEGSLRSFIGECRQEGSVSLLIGPEGGFSEKELHEAAGNHWHSLHFGFTQLRAETAALVLPSIIIYEWSL